MSKIHVLREDTISKIAAGEVVERPSAIIKELFENSVDASATEIVVEIESGGKDLIRVTDNGSGIGREDADLLFARHATSKISGIGDLYSLKTMGFRGEALHSIAAVSKVVLVTKQEVDSVGMRMEIMGGEMKNKSDIAALRGTMMEVTDLFYNTPVRWKFMRTTTQETRSCIEIMNKLAVANARISVTFKVDGNLVFKTDGKDDLQSTVFQVFGRSIAEDMMKLDFRNEMIAVSGLSSKFSLRKKNRNYIMTFVNGRYVKSQELTRTIEGCYRSHLMGGEFPVSFVFLEIDPSEIDVNVHPAKIEIKFADLSKVNAAITSAIKTAINAHTHVPVAYRNNAFWDERGFYESAGTLSASSSAPACTSASTLPS
ncbi:MAG: DNA mismatch repair endonuclease MutL, partial [Bacillota bacterium]|nr:DNA mismatch repair endonuclease MutL [Bacillota bacterium]